MNDILFRVGGGRAMVFVRLRAVGACGTGGCRRAKARPRLRSRLWGEAGVGQGAMSRARNEWVVGQGLAVGVKPRRRTGVVAEVAGGVGGSGGARVGGVGWLWGARGGWCGGEVGGGWGGGGGAKTLAGGWRRSVRLRCRDIEVREKDFFAAWRSRWTANSKAMGTVYLS